MFSKYKMTEREKCELEEYRGTGLSPRQIRSIKREAEKMREYIEFLETL
jgi:hypothetical protein